MPKVTVHACLRSLGLAAALLASGGAAFAPAFAPAQAFALRTSAAMPMGALGIAHRKRGTALMLAKGRKQPANKGFGEAPPAQTTKAEAGQSLDQSALLALIADAPQRRETRERMLASRAQELKDALETETYTVIDGLLGENLCSAMRAEAMTLLGGAALAEDIIDSDTRAASVIIEPELFLKAPLCTEYVLDCAKTMAPLLSGRFGPLSTDAACSMLACYGVDGGNFPVHIDNHGAGDPRVLTLIYYMNPGYDANRQGGRFVPWTITDAAPPKAEPPVMLSAADHLEPLSPIDPIADRLVAFWTCELPHSVEAFKAQFGKEDGRYAITVWLTAEPGSNVFEQGRHILSPTPAHDARAILERGENGQEQAEEELEQPQQPEKEAASSAVISALSAALAAAPAAPAAPADGGRAKDDALAKAEAEIAALKRQLEEATKRLETEVTVTAAKVEAQRLKELDSKIAAVKEEIAALEKKRKGLDADLEALISERDASIGSSDH